MFHYISYGLNIQSEIELPELFPHNNTTEIDIYIKYGSVPDQIENPIDTKLCWQTKHQELLLNVNNVCKYWIHSANTIVLEPYPEIDEKSVRLFLLGSSLGAILLQKQYLPLHANCLSYRGNAFAFAGDSGIGKSTLAAALEQHGFNILTDDVCSIKLINSKPFVYPGTTNIKLWQNSLERLEKKYDNLESVRPEMKKYLQPINNQNHLEPVPLRKIYFLKKHTKEEVTITTLEPKLAILQAKRNTYRYQFAKGMGLEKVNFMQYLQIIQNVDTSLIHRPKSGFKIDQLVDSVIKDIKQYE